MVCLYCGSDLQVINSRPQKRNNQVWRRRKCKQCGALFTTHEIIELHSALSVKNNGHFRPFLPDLLYTEVLLAMQDRKDCYTAAREVISTVVGRLLALPNKPAFTPAEISLETAQVLQKLDKRAWLRYTAEHPSLQ